ncbi:hypothetical protein PMO31116_04204 [Pandoraea morbifera]|uniref:Uncharacterized protein n=1 Tax=Pandoraea morbifera TaxID=2508300 RepID=A0A5E4Y235_9BURK|nr:hypothetical protein PMO31116_04204 [Pandoraea morbifera]
MISPTSRLQYPLLLIFLRGRWYHRVRRWLDKPLARTVIAVFRSIDKFSRQIL